MASDAADIGLIGLAVMGQNLALNMADHGHRVAVYNRSTDVTRAFINGPAAQSPAGSMSGHETLEAFLGALERPRRIVLMVRAGAATDAVIASLLPLLDRGDVILDCGNSHHEDTVRRLDGLREHGIRFLGCGVSGGEEGARHGPSIMPGGDPDAWPLVGDILRSIAAVVDGEPCCDWVGEGGAGHYVKMVHNGIEYGDMQLICEVYDLLHRGLGLDHDRMAGVFAQWNQGRLDSYLVEITADILGFRDEDGEPLVTRILDTAGQKGTGKWTGISALGLGIPVSLIAEAVFSRCLFATRDERGRAAAILQGPSGQIDIDAAGFIDDLEGALYAAKVVSYAQGFLLLAAASREYGWRLRLGPIASLWRGGCIIRSRFLGDIRRAFDEDATLDSLLVDPYFARTLGEAQAGWRRVVSAAASAGIPVPGLSAGLAFYDGYRSERLPANLLQAQRDYFGGHTYERIDRPRGEFFHTDWTGRGGAVSSRTYDV